MTFTLASARNVCALAVSASVAALALAAPAGLTPTPARPAATRRSCSDRTHMSKARARATPRRAGGRFVVDIDVEVYAHLNFRGQLAASDVPGPVVEVPAASYPLATSCDQYSQALTVYRRLETGGFVEVGSSRYRGELYFDSTDALRSGWSGFPRGSTLGQTPWGTLLLRPQLARRILRPLRRSVRPVRVHASTW